MPRSCVFNYGISGLVLNDDGTAPETLAKVASAIDSALTELGTGKQLGISTQLTTGSPEEGVAALQAFDYEGYAPDFILADLQGQSSTGDYADLLLYTNEAIGGRCGLITVHNMDLVSSDSGADGKLYADPYEAAYQLYENRGTELMAPLSMDILRCAAPPTIWRI